MHRAPGTLQRRSAALNRVLIVLGLVVGIALVYGVYFAVVWSTMTP
jgi:hypothetical protein